MQVAPLSFIVNYTLNNVNMYENGQYNIAMHWFDPIVKKKHPFWSTRASLGERSTEQREIVPPSNKVLLERILLLFLLLSLLLLPLLLILLLVLLLPLWRLPHPCLSELKNGTDLTDTKYLSKKLASWSKMFVRTCSLAKLMICTLMDLRTN